MQVPFHPDALRDALRRRCLADVREQLEEYLRRFVYVPSPATGLAGRFKVSATVRHAPEVRAAVDDLARAMFSALLLDAGEVELRPRHRIAILREAAELMAGAIVVESDAPDLEPVRNLMAPFRDAARRLGQFRGSVTGRLPRLPTDARLRTLTEEVADWTERAPADAAAAVAELRRGILADFSAGREERRGSLAVDVRAALTSTRATPRGRAVKILAAWFGTTPQAIRKANKRTTR